jgi:hypothetical protein
VGARCAPSACLCDKFSGCKRGVRGLGESGEYLGEVMAKNSEQEQRFCLPVT